MSSSIRKVEKFLPERSDVSHSNASIYIDLFVFKYINYLINFTQNMFQSTIFRPKFYRLRSERLLDTSQITDFDRNDE